MDKIKELGRELDLNKKKIKKLFNKFDKKFKNLPSNKKQKKIEQAIRNIYGN